MSPLGWLLGLLLPACGTSGAEGVVPPPPLDLARLERPATPNTALAAPAGARDRDSSDIVTPRYGVPAALLWLAVQGVAEHQPRTYRLTIDPPAMQGSWVARSAVWNFPDVLTARVWSDGPDGSTLALYSRSIYGHSDLGVNRKRLETWLAALNATLKPGS